MKAKEYAQRYVDEGKTPEALFRVWRDMMGEFGPIMRQRGTTSDAAAVAVIRETDRKWRAFTRIANDKINPDGFMNVIKEKMPEIYLKVKP